MAGRRVRPSAVRWLGGLLVGVTAVAAVSGLIELRDQRVLPLSLLVLYILPVLAVAVVWGTGLAVLTAGSRGFSSSTLCLTPSTVLMTFASGSLTTTRAMPSSSSTRTRPVRVLNVSSTVATSLSSTLPLAVDLDAPTATFENGVLSLTLPKKSDAPLHRVTIN